MMLRCESRRKAVKKVVCLILLVGACAIFAYLLFVVLPEREKQRKDWLRNLKRDIPVQRDLLDAANSDEQEEGSRRANHLSQKPQTIPVR